MNTPRICPICGNPVPANARACPECGADEQTGWSETAYEPQPDLPDEEFDYNQFIESEFGGGTHPRRRLSTFWLLAVLAVLAAVLLLWL